MQKLSNSHPSPLGLVESRSSRNEDTAQSGMKEDCDNISTYPLDSPKIYNFPGTNTWIGFESEVSTPALVQVKWPSIKERLLIALEVINKDMIAEQSREKHARKKHPKRRVFTPELRMSGRRENWWSDNVKVSPCIWILCGSKWCRDKIRKVTKSFDLPVRLFKQRIEVHCGGPTFNADQTLVPRAKLHMDPSRSLVLNEQEGFILYHHIEGRSEGIKSVCGRVCCTTLVKGDRIIDQHVSRIGGVLVRGFFNYDFDIFPLAITTAHGAFECLFWPQLRDNRPFGDSIEVNYSDGGSDMSSESEDDEDYTKDLFQSSYELQHLGCRQVAEINEWIPLDHTVGINFMGKRFQFEDPSDPNTTPADYTVLKFDGLRDTHNVIRSTPEVAITTHTLNEGLSPGPISLVLGLDNISEALLLPGTVQMKPTRETLTVRKIQLPRPLGTISR